MRNKLIFISLFFILMAGLPLSFTLYGTQTSPEKPQTEQSADSEAEAAARLCGSGFCDEAVKAAAIIARTNAAAGSGSGEGAGDISDKELYERVKKIYHSDKEILSYSGKPVFIPASSCSSGSTEKSSSLEYLDGVASPWDAFSENYSGALSCEGVSMSGIDYLCRTGMSAEEALLWYLPRLRIESGCKGCDYSFFTSTAAAA